MFGPRNCGKSQIVLGFLEKFCRVYHIPNENFDDHYEDGEFDLAYSGEFKGGKSIQWINNFVQGGACVLKRKGISPVIKNVNIPVIFDSNFSIRRCFSKYDIANPGAEDLKALVSRFESVECFEGDIFGFYNNMDNVDVPQQWKDELAKSRKGRKRKRNVYSMVMDRDYDYGGDSFECGEKNGGECNYVDCDHVF